MQRKALRTHLSLSTEFTSLLGKTLIQNTIEEILFNGEETSTPHLKTSVAESHTRFHAQVQVIVERSLPQKPVKMKDDHRSALQLQEAINMRSFLLAFFVIVSCSFCIITVSSYQYGVKGQQQQTSSQQQDSLELRCTGPRHLGEKRCRARMIRYAYDNYKGDCVRFIYGGCGAGPNNFRTMEECRELCAAHKNTQEVTKTGYYYRS